MLTAKNMTLQPGAVLRQRILVVEDEPVLRRLNTEVLVYSGYQVDAAEDGRAAWDALQVNAYDLMVTDHKMPNLSGVDLLKKARAAHLALPVIMATGSLPDWSFTAYPSLRPTAVLLKPYTFEELLNTVKDVLYAVASNHPETAPPPNWQGQPLPNRLPL